MGTTVFLTNGEMGDNQSKGTKRAPVSTPRPAPAPAPPPAPFLEKYWRTPGFGNWTAARRDDLKGGILNFNPGTAGHLNVLILGQVSAGKSSFINNINTAFEGYCVNTAHVGVSDNQEFATFTKDYRMYNVTKDYKTGQPLKFHFWDTMGLEGGNFGLQIADVEKMMDGFIPDGTNLTERVYSVAKDKEKEKINCVVFLIDANSALLTDPAIVQKWIGIRQAANKRRMDPIVVLTHVDHICEDTKDEMSRLFYSKKIGKLVTGVSVMLGTQESMLCPVVNYTGQTEKDVNIDILTLLTLRQILRSCESRM